MAHSTPTTVGSRWCLSVLVGASLLLGTAGVADAKSRATHVVGYVSAGAPISGASLRVYGPSGGRLALRTRGAAAKSNANGFFYLVVRGRPSTVRVVARGGTYRRHRLKGSLEAIVPDPGLDRTVYVDPVTTVIAAYAELHPERSLAFAERKATRLLSMEADDPVGRALRSVTPDFNGLKFLRKARRHGGVQDYVDQLIDDGDPVAFRAAATSGGIADYVKLLMSAKDAVSAVATIGKNAYDFYNWVSGKKDTTEEIYDAVQKMQTQLANIQTSLNRIQDELGEGFVALKDELNKEEFANAVAPLQTLAGKVEATQGYFEDLVNNRLAGPPTFSQQLVDARMADIRENMKDIEAAFQRGNDVFRNAILRSQNDPAYYFAGQNLLSQSRHFMTPAASQQLTNFANYVLQYQAFAFNLIVHWETNLSPDRPTTTLNNAVKLYLGFDDARQTASWVEANPDTEAPTIPATGDLHDELAYLDTIRQVPAGTIVEADGLENAPGPMWQRKDHGKVLLGRTIYARPGDPGMGCADLYAPATAILGGFACQYMAKGWQDAQAQLQDASRGLDGTGWHAATADQTQALFTRVKSIPKDALKDLLEIQPLYWSPADYTVASSDYFVLPATSTSPAVKCDRNTTYNCTYYTRWIDQVTVTTLASDPAKPFKGTCRFGVGTHKGGTCPELWVLLRREPAAGERYWPPR
jgi:hypothetical protein